jgi:hypothetical protein
LIIEFDLFNSPATQKVVWSDSEPESNGSRRLIFYLNHGVISLESRPVHAMNNITTCNSNNSLDHWSAINNTLSNCSVLRWKDPGFIYSQPPVK